MVTLRFMSEQRVQQWATPRIAPRYILDQRLVIKAGVTLHGRTKDISETGLGATVAGELKMQDTVMLEFYLPGSLVLQRFMAEVRYRKGFQYGFCFLRVSEEQKNLIREAALHLKLVI